MGLPPLLGLYSELPLPEQRFQLRARFRAAVLDGGTHAVVILPGGGGRVLEVALATGETR